MTAPGIMGQWWIDREIARAANQNEPPSDLWVPVNKETMRDDEWSDLFRGNIPPGACVIVILLAFVAAVISTAAIFLLNWIFL